MSTCPACEDCGQPQEGPAPGIGYWCTNDACPSIERGRAWVREQLRREKQRKLPTGWRFEIRLDQDFPNPRFILTAPDGSAGVFWAEPGSPRSELLLMLNEAIEQ